MGEGVNSEICSLLGCWGYHDKSVDKACYLLEWIVLDSFEFKKASRVFRYSFSNPCAFYARSYYAPFCYDLYNSFDHDINPCPYYACYAQPGFA